MLGSWHLDTYSIYGTKNCLKTHDNWFTVRKHTNRDLATEKVDCDYYIIVWEKPLWNCDHPQAIYTIDITEDEYKNISSSSTVKDLFAKCSDILWRERNSRAFYSEGDSFSDRQNYNEGTHSYVIDTLGYHPQIDLWEQNKCFTETQSLYDSETVDDRDNYDPDDDWNDGYDECECPEYQAEDYYRADLKDSIYV